MRRFTLAALTVATTLGAVLTAVPAEARADRLVLGPENCAGNACHFDVPAGTYEVRVRLGGDAAASTAVTGETRRTLLAETATDAGEHVRLSFTVDVRTPEGEPTGPDGTPGLDLFVGGSAPALADIRVTRAERARQILLVGDSTVCDQPGDPYSGWGSSSRSTSARACRSPTTPTPARARSPTSPTPGCGPPSSRGSAATTWS